MAQPETKKPRRASPPPHACDVGLVLPPIDSREEVVIVGRSESIETPPSSAVPAAPPSPGLSISGEMHAPCEPRAERVASGEVPEGRVMIGKAPSPPSRNTHWKRLQWQRRQVAVTPSVSMGPPLTKEMAIARIREDIANAVKTPLSGACRDYTNSVITLIDTYFVFHLPGK